MIKIRYRDPRELAPGLYAAAERHGRGTTVYLLPGLTVAQRRSALRRLRISARRGRGPRLPAAQLAVALLADRIRTATGRAGAVFRLHPAASTVPVMVVSPGRSRSCACRPSPSGSSAAPGTGAPPLIAAAALPASGRRMAGGGRPRREPGPPRRGPRGRRRRADPPRPGGEGDGDGDGDSRAAARRRPARSSPRHRARWLRPRHGSARALPRERRIAGRPCSSSARYPGSGNNRTWEDGLSRRGWLLFAAMGVIWGIPYLLIKVADGGVSVPVLVFTRVALGSLLLLPAAIRGGYLGALKGHVRWLAAFTAFEIVGPFALLSSAEKRLPSSTSGLLVAAVPIFSALLAWLTRSGDRLTLGPVGRPGHRPGRRRRCWPGRARATATRCRSSTCCSPRSATPSGR